jgi:hypothetical protein
VSALGCDRDFNYVVIGDTAGHVRIWDVSDGINTSSPEACMESFKEVRREDEGGGGRSSM